MVPSLIFYLYIETFILLTKVTVGIKIHSYYDFDFSFTWYYEITGVIFIYIPIPTSNPCSVFFLNNNYSLCEACYWLHYLERSKSWFSTKLEKKVLDMGTKDVKVLIDLECVWDKVTHSVNFGPHSLSFLSFTFGASTLLCLSLILF